jgi:hypothetical protein
MNNEIDSYLASNQVESDLMIIERQLHRLTQEVRHVQTQMESLIALLKAYKGSQRR